jgi:formylglycine-generating enzyme required for sulfatase activity
MILSLLSLLISPVGAAERVELPAGTFLMGHEEAEFGDYGQRFKENEFPAHEVSIDAFAMDRTEVPVADWVAFLNTEPGRAHHHPHQPVTWDAEAGFGASESEADRPIRYVSWFDAAAYCAHVGARLPTEAEWEYAATGGEHMKRWPWDDTGPDCSTAVFYTERVHCEPGPAPVGSRSPAGDTPSGLSDMAGNVAEWVFDWEGPYGTEAEDNPTGPAQGERRTIRGGDHQSTDAAVRTLSRVSASPSLRGNGLGFRCVVGQ